MMVENISIGEVLQTDPAGYVLLDVRSPSEYAQGHIPGAFNLPLFSDEERAAVGTVYKTMSPHHAMQRGLEIVGPKMQGIVDQALKLYNGKPIVVHCWRGGKRSSSIGWLLDFAGMSVSVLTGGYKAYRTYQRSWIDTQPLNLIILGGKTGSGKTDLLHALSAKGEQVLDLEQLAHHKGSAFGWMGELEQPSTEQFENDIFEVVRKLDLTKRIWIENESLTIGKVFIPQPLWNKMKSAPLIQLEVPIDVRVQNLVDIYAGGDAKEALISSFQKISARLGGQHVKAALEALANGDYHQAAEVALTYYDKTYYYGLEQRNAQIIGKIDTDNMYSEQIVETLIIHAQQLHTQSLAH